MAELMTHLTKQKLIKQYNEDLIFKTSKKVS